MRYKEFDNNIHGIRVVKDYVKEFANAKIDNLAAMQLKEFEVS
jgi:hypothetical protein